MTTYFVRTENNETIIDIEAMEDDISCTVDIEMYTVHLFSLSPLLYAAWMQNIAETQEIRGFYHENNQEKLSPPQLAEKWCRKLAEKWDLIWTVD